MELDIKTLTEEQKQEVQNGYKYIINDKNKLERISTPESDQYELSQKKAKLYEEFNDSLKVIEEKYTQKERETFDIKVKEAEAFLSTGASEFLESLCIEGETVEELANKILENNRNYRLLYANAEKKLREGLKAIGEL